MNTTELIDNYIAIWNETDDSHRRDLIAQTWTEDAAYIDPLVSGVGYDGIDAMTQAVQTQFAGLKFRRTGDIDTHHDNIRFAWELGPENGDALAGGVDFGVIAAGRLKTITGFIDFAPGAAGE